MDIRYIDHGIGFTVNDGENIYIELNRKLLKYPELHKKVLDHEFEHYHKGNTMFDFWIDFKSLLDIPFQYQLWLFTQRHPEARSCWKIIIKEKGKRYINWFALFVFSYELILFILLIGVLIYIT